MTPMIKDFGRCGCGRSTSGYCDGSHALTVEEYTRQLISRVPEHSIMPEITELTIDRDSKRIPYAPT